MANRIQGTSSDPMTVRDTIANDFEPAHGDDQIVAMFETRERADTARDALMQQGVESGRVRILAHGEGLGTEADDQQSGFWGMIRSLFMPDEDRHGYGEALRRGHVMLVVYPRPGERDRIVHTLDSLEPVDFDARLEEWRSAGWNGIYAGQDPDQPSRLAVPPGANPIPPGATSIPSVGSPAQEETAREASGLAGSGRVGTGLPSGDLPSGEMRTGGMRTEEMRGATIAGNTADAGLGSDRPIQEGMRREREETIPLTEERLRVGKRMVDQGSVRVRTYTVEHPVQEQVNLRDESVKVERHPVDRPAGAMGEDPFRERSVEVRAMSEEPVVEKEARVREEVAVRKDAQEHTETVNDSVRRTEVDVDDNRRGSLDRPGHAPGGTGPKRKG